MHKMRITHVIVQPVLVIDDGEELIPGPVLEPIPIALRDIAEWAEQTRHDVAKIVLNKDQGKETLVYEDEK